MAPVVETALSRPVTKSTYRILSDSRRMSEVVLAPDLSDHFCSEGREPFEIA